MPDVVFQGPVGRIEGRYHVSKNRDAPIVILLSPHPKYGGTMDNRVIFTLYRCFRSLNFSVLRFNFRSVGKSEGSFDQGEGELNDAACALDWLQSKNHTTSRFWIAGFSFGAWIGMQLLMRRPEVEGFVAISPPANLYDFSFLAPCPTSGLIIQGRIDKIVDEASVSSLVEKLSCQKQITVDYTLIDEADHFFTKKQDDLFKSVQLYIKSSLEIYNQRFVA